MQPHDGDVLLARLQQGGDHARPGVDRDRQGPGHVGVQRAAVAHGVHAEPTTFGLKLAGWAFELERGRERLDDRKNLLSNLDRIKRSVDERGLEGVDKFQEQAFTTIVGGVAKAFDLSLEDPKTVARYDTAPLVRPDQISRKWNNYNNYVDNAKSLGKLLLGGFIPGLVMGLCLMVGVFFSPESVRADRQPFQPLMLLANPMNSSKSSLTSATEKL